MFSKFLVILSGLFVTSITLAADQTGSSQQGVSSMIIMFVLFIVIFYFLLIRPQQKKAKEQKQLMEDLSIGDEIVTAGGIVGRITKLRDDFLVLAVFKDVEITLQKNAVGSVLPKGTIESSS